MAKKLCISTKKRTKRLSLRPYFLLHNFVLDHPDICTDAGNLSSSVVGIIVKISLNKNNWCSLVS